MSMDDLQTDLRRIFSHKPVVILTLGHPLKGDDAIGSYIGKNIETKSSEINIYNAETVPSNFLGKIVINKPKTLLVIDAVDLGEDPGTIALFSEEGEKKMRSFSTHYQDIQTLMKYIEMQNKSRPDVTFLGIQFEQIELNQPISESVLNKADELIKIINSALDDKI